MKEIVSAPTPTLYERNIENFIGLARLPVGVAGPVLIHGTAARGEFVVPLATTEATLVASYHRGMKLITAAGGCNAAILDERLERTPLFVLRDLNAAAAFALWVRERTAELSAAAERTSRFAQCTAIETVVEGNHVYLRCAYRTGEAAGQNMVTIATAAVCAVIRDTAPTEILQYVIEANLSGDKKASACMLMGTRGKRVSADVTIPRDLVLAKLHVSPERLADYWRFCAVGAAMSGTVGIHGHYANGLAALAIATGQDVACVAESATGITRVEVDDRGSLYACVTLPNIIVGTVGGGTKLPTQSEGLRLVAGDRALTSRTLAEVTAALLLAGELSIGGAICADEFSTAHQRFARGVCA